MVHDYTVIFVIKALLLRNHRKQGLAFAQFAVNKALHLRNLSWTTFNKSNVNKQGLQLQAGVLPSGEAVCSVPNTLVALCLNNAGLERVRQTKALACFLPIFTSKAYIKPLQGDTPPALGAGLDELLRHVSSLRKEGVEMITDILKTLCEMGGEAHFLRSCLMQVGRISAPVCSLPALPTLSNALKLI